MLLLFILSFVCLPLEIQTKASNYFAVELFIVGQPHWQVGQCWDLPQPGQPLREFPVLCCTGKLGTGIQLEKSFLQEMVMKPTLSLVLHGHFDRLSHRNTFNVSLSTSASRAPISLAVIPLSSHISSQGMMQHH